VNKGAHRVAGIGPDHLGTGVPIPVRNPATRICRAKGEIRAYFRTNVETIGVGARYRISIPPCCGRHRGKEYLQLGAVLRLPIERLLSSDCDEVTARRVAIGKMDYKASTHRACAGLLV
jgi:hypothetical protein